MDTKNASKGIRYNYLSNITAVQNACARRINRILKKNQYKNTLLLLSGGSSFSILKFINTELINNRCTVGVLDERYTHYRENNNFYNLTQTDFYKKIQKTARYIRSLPEKDESIVDLSEYINDQINDWFIHDPDGVVIATCGIRC